MKLTKKTIEEYKEIYQRKFGETLTDKEAYEQASNLIRIFYIIFQALTSEQENKNTKDSCN